MPVEPVFSNALGNINNLRLLKIKYMLADKDISTSILRFATNTKTKIYTKFIDNHDIVEIGLALSMLNR